MAALEWARNEAFQARDAEPVRAEALAEVPPEEWPALTFGAAPGVVLRPSAWDLAGWWNGDGSEPPAEAPGGQVLLVWRDESNDVRHEPLAPDDAEAVRRLFSGAPFAEVCEAYAPEGTGEAAAEEAGRRAVALLLTMIGRCALTTGA